MYFFFTSSSLCFYSLIEKWGLAPAEKKKTSLVLWELMFIHLLALGAFFCRDPHSLSSLHSPSPLPSRPQQTSPTSPSVWPWTSVALPIWPRLWILANLQARELRDRKERRTEVCLSWLLFSQRCTAAAIRGHHWARGFTLPERIIFFGKFAQNRRPKYFCFLYQFVRAQWCNVRFWHRIQKSQESWEGRGRSRVWETRDNKSKCSFDIQLCFNTNHSFYQSSYCFQECIFLPSYKSVLLNN